MRLGFAIESSDIDLQDIDLSNIDLDLLDTDIPSKHFLVFKASSRSLKHNNYSPS